MTLIQTHPTVDPLALRLSRAAARIASAGLRTAPPLLLGLSFPAALLALWSFGASSGWLPPQILPAPRVVWESFALLLADGSLGAHTQASLHRVATGFALGAAIGLAFGAAVGLLPAVRAYGWPPVQAVTRVNVLAWMPLLTLFLGIDETLKVVVIAWSAAIPIILGTARGFADVPAGYRELGAAMGLRPHQRLRLIVLPGALPQVFTGLREGLANAWQTLVIVELFASFEGLGYLMTWGRQLFQLDLVLVAMLVIAAIGFLLDGVLKIIEARVQPWRTESGRDR
ncbi:ABC transporter permease [Cereibacter azotoformans]|uniref:Sulfonate transport system permease protein n=1 Tax=Cereibacter azotoformans TaxID=43057 RepID=A0A2T5JT53_9RHOB|nr:ABC transporter permease [Cereibacter azotoformans]AXQ95713.1 ABC transporter permease [Cereibacter sphaeroides]PTR12998.1 sulfonate transport system permease protein [Cereibacter azotoformans]UIJ32790.1 ABC transporter permease [Cereibacter azotoformans]